MRDLLKANGFPDSVLAVWQADGVRQLLPIQARALEAGILAGKNCIVVGPTSCGKTFVGELVCVKQALSRRSCLYLVPFKALAEEKYAEFQRKYERREIGAGIVISTADRRQQDRRLVDGDFNIAILTYEKLSVLLVTSPGILSNVGALIVDEIQMIGDPSRGAELELLLTRVRQIAPTVQIVGLSAVVSDSNGFEQWLEADKIWDPHRPVPLREGVINDNGEFRFLEWVGTEKKSGSEKLCELSSETLDDRATELAKHFLENKDEQVLVFASTVQGTRALALAIAETCSDLSPAKKIIEALSYLEASDNATALVSALGSAVAFHNADLTPEERSLVENGFRTGLIRCVVSTSTLSMGVNLPASTVIIVRPKKWVKEFGGRWQELPIPVAEYRNMSGRAGRFGLVKDTYGRSILVASSAIDAESLFRSYVQGEPEILESSLLDGQFEMLLLTTLASGLCNTESGCQRFFMKTFAARQAWSTPELQQELSQQIADATDNLMHNGLVERLKGDKMTVTRLGVICAHSGLSPECFVRVVDLVRAGDTSIADIAFVTSICLETGPDAVGLRFSKAEHVSETARYVHFLTQANELEPGPMTTTFLDGLSQALLPPYEEARQIKFQAIAHAFANGVASQDIEQQFSDTSGARARAVGWRCSWVCDTASQVAWALGDIDRAKKYETLSERLLHGCTESALFLAHVPHKLHRAERELLVRAGFTVFQKIIDTSAVEIAKTAKVSKARVEALQKAILAAIGASLELERQQLSRLIALGVDIRLVEALYTAQGKALEQTVEDVLQPPFCPLTVARIALQRENEADLKIVLSTGHNGIAQVHAKERPTERVALVKAGSVLQQSPELKPKVFICFGRPDFMDAAIRKAREHAQNGRNYKLIPVSVLAEAYVRFHEKRLSSTKLAEILEKETGYISIERL